jgi:peroxiredoxin
MKKIILFVFLGIITLISCANGNKNAGYEIKGKIGEYNSPAKIYLQYVENNEVVTQSETLENGSFSFSGHVSSPSNGRIVIIPDGSPVNNQKAYEQTLSIIVGNEKFSINSADFIANATITGSLLNDDLKKLHDQLKTVNDKKNNLLLEYYNSSQDEQNDVEFQVFARERLSAVENETKEVYKKFIRENPQSYISLIALVEYQGQIQDVNEIDALLRSLSPELQETEDGKYLAQQLSASKTTAIGSVAPDFSQNDPEGNPVRLSDFRGKYLLLDFWASWCGPCRKENPNVVRVYDQYKDKNFEILGVSLDNPGAKQNWLNAISKDGLAWPQVSDLKGWQNAVAQQYSVQSIPQNFLLDPNGVIIAKNLRGNQLDEVLGEYLK